MDAKDLAAQERKFLHDLSNQLVIAQGMSSYVKKCLEEPESVSDEELTMKRTQKLMKALDRMTDMINERRAILHSLNN